MSNFWELLKYSFVASSSAIADWIVFTISIYFNSHFLVAQCTSRLSGGATSFFLNRFWTFPPYHKNKLYIQTKRFFLLYCLSYVLSISVVYLLVEIVEIHVFISKLSADIICFFLNFFAMKLYVFRNTNKFK